jgi:hypothetical protein
MNHDIGTLEQRAQIGLAHIRASPCRLLEAGAREPTRDPEDLLHRRIAREACQHARAYIPACSSHDHTHLA